MVPYEERVVFHASFESLMRAIGDRMDPSLEAQLRGVGFDPKRSNQPAYSYQAWARSLALAAERFVDVAPEGRPMLLLGRRFIEQFGKTLVGSAVVQLAKLMGPRRMLARMTRNFRSANSYSETSLEELSPTHGRLMVQPVAYPDFFVGLLLASMEISGARDARVQLLSHEGETCIFDVTWS